MLQILSRKCLKNLWATRVKASLGRESKGAIIEWTFMLEGIDADQMGG